MACIDAEKFDEAIAHFSETIRLRPDAADPYAKRGYVYEQKGEHDLAIVDYTQALQIAPNSDTAYCLRGIAYSMKGQNDNALADFSKAIQIDPNEASYYGYRGIAYFSIDDMANANADLQRGMQIDPNDEILADLAEALAEEGVQGGMSAQMACTQCGSPLEEGEMFCANCGAKVGAVPQQQSVPVQAQRQAVAPQYQSVPAQAQRQYKKRIFIIDGSMFIAKQLEVILEQEGYVVVDTANDEFSALEKYKTLHHNIDLVFISDRMNGVVVLEEILEINNKANVIMLTNLGNEKVVEECLRIGAKSYIVKPLNRKKVLERIVSVLS